MLNFIRRLFGQGRIKAKFICSDGTEGTVKAPYTGQWNESEALDALKEEIEFKYDKKIVHIELVAHIKE